MFGNDAAPNRLPASAWAVSIHVGGQHISGDLTMPVGARGLVIFAHGSGSSRRSSRNRMVADALSNERLATLLLDLLTEEEERIDAANGELRFDIPLLARRVTAAVDWAATTEQTRRLPIGLFGASTGAAAALIAAAARPGRVRAVVSRGGRSDLAGPALEALTTPTLLIVGSLDQHVVDLNRQALERLRSTRHLELVPDASHLFEEPGALDRVATLATEWFVRYLG